MTTILQSNPNRIRTNIGKADLRMTVLRAGFRSCRFRAGGRKPRKAWKDGR